MRRGQPQAATEPASTPSHSVASSIQPASSTTSRLSCVIGIGSSRIDVTSMPPGVVNGAVPATVAGIGVGAERDGSLAGRRAELTGVLPHAHRLRAERDPVERRLVTVLTRHRDLPARPWASRAAMTPPAMPSFSREHCVDLVVLGREELLHLRLGDGGIPVVGVGLTDDLDVAGRHRFTDDLLGAFAEEVGVGVGRVALDDDVLAPGTRAKTAWASIRPTSTLSKVM